MTVICLPYNLMNINNNERLSIEGLNRNNTYHPHEIIFRDFHAFDAF